MDLRCVQPDTDRVDGECSVLGHPPREISAHLLALQLDRQIGESLESRAGRNAKRPYDCHRPEVVDLRHHPHGPVAIAKGDVAVAEDRRHRRVREHHAVALTLQTQSCDALACCSGTAQLTLDRGEVHLLCNVEESVQQDLPGRHSQALVGPDVRRPHVRQGRRRVGQRWAGDSARDVGTSPDRDVGKISHPPGR